MSVAPPLSNLDAAASIGASPDDLSWLGGTAVAVEDPATLVEDDSVAAVADERADTEFFGEVDELGRPLGLDAGESMLWDVCQFTGRYAIAKRTLDIVGAVAGLVVLGIPMLIAMSAVYLKDGRGVLFRQKRVGKAGQQFTLLKIRTMCVDAEARLEEFLKHNRHDDHRTFKMEQDPRVIPGVGAFLRRFSIDEFPQLINVLTGQMSLVGPRPALPREVECYSATDKLRLCVKPGLTCFWQVGGRGHLSFQEQLQLDMRYIDECSLRTDLKLIAQTIPALVVGQGAC